MRIVQTWDWSMADMTLEKFSSEGKSQIVSSLWNEWIFFVAISSQDRCECVTFEKVFHTHELTILSKIEMKNLHNCQG